MLFAHRKSTGKTLTNGGSAAQLIAVTGSSELPLSCLQAVATRSSKRKSEEEVDRFKRAAAAKLDSRKTAGENLLVSLDDGNSKADFSEDSIDSGK